MLALMRPIATSALPVALVTLVVACDSETAHPEAHPAATPATFASTTAAPAPPEVRAPDIVVDPGYVAVGNDRVLGGDPGLADRISVFLNGRPMIEGRTVDVIGMRNAKPSQVTAVIVALKRAKATGAAIKTEARDNSTQRLPLSFDPPLQPCTTIAWIAKDAAIDVWPVGGGTAKRIYKGLAGPDMTLGTEAIGSVGARCDASELVVGADEAMTWGLVFDLATMALKAPGARTSKAVLVASAVPGRKLVVE
jgi:hypothetical protein